MEKLSDNELQNEKSMRAFLLKKYLIDWLVLITLLVSIFIMRHFVYIENTIVGTLLGAIVGYFARGIKKIHE